MNSVDPEATLAQLVTDRPELSAPLDRLGIDYCCGGQRSMASAVVDAGLDLPAVLSELETVEHTEVDAAWTGIDGLVDHLESTHHMYLREALPRLTALAEKVAGVHGERHAELAGVAGLVHELEADLEPHMRKAEQVLFPMIRELATATNAPSFHCGSLRNPISVMMAEHDAVGDLLAELRDRTSGYHVPDDGCASYAALSTGLAELEADTLVHALGREHRHAVGRTACRQGQDPCRAHHGSTRPKAHQSRLVRSRLRTRAAVPF